MLSLIDRPAGTALAVVPELVTADAGICKVDATLAFYHETCGTCVYMLDDRPSVSDTIQMPCCRVGSPSSNGGNFHADHPRVGRERHACGQWRQNPFLRSDDDV